MIDKLNALAVEAESTGDGAIASVLYTLIASLHCGAVVELSYYNKAFAIKMLREIKQAEETTINLN